MLSTLRRPAMVLLPLLITSPLFAQSGDGWQCQSVDGEWQCQPLVKVSPAKRGVSASVAGAAVISTANKHNWYWQPSSELPADCSPLRGCGGNYVPPPNDSPDAALEPAQAPIRVSAQQSSMQGGLVELSGEVIVDQGYRRIRAQQATLDRDRGELTLSGEIEILEPDQAIRGQQASLNNQTGSIQISGAQAQQFSSGTRISAETIERSGNQSMTITNASYTQCPPDQESWLLRGDRFDIDYATGFGTGRNTSLRVGDIPVLYTPWIMFPIDDRRMTGLLWPTLASGADNGVEISTPLYLNIAPNMDATFTPHYIQERGTQLELEARYLHRYLGTWTAGGAYLGDDKLRGDDRWLHSLQQQGRPASGWRTSIDYTEVSDNDYFDDLDLSNLDARRRTHLRQRAEVNYSSRNWAADLNILDYQTIDNEVEKPYQQLPQLSLRNIGESRNFRPDWLLETEYTMFDHEDSVSDGGDQVTGNRLYAETGLRLPMRWAAGFIIPSAGVRHLRYDLDEQDEEQTVTSATADLDMGLVFERRSNLGSGYVQTLEPRLYYLYGEYKDQRGLPDFDTRELDFSYQQLFRDTRFSGRDRLDDANQLSLGITNRLISEHSGREILTVSFGEILYFRDREVTADTVLTAQQQQQRPNSNFAFQADYQPSESVWISTVALLDHYNNEVDEGGLSLQYRPASSEWLFNLGYRFRRDAASIENPWNNQLIQRDAEQFDGSLVMPIADRWRAFMQMRYDANENRSMDNLIGIEYEDCCWMTRLVYQRSIDSEQVGPNGNIGIDYDYAFVLEFQLKGLGSLMGTAANMLEDNILGYRDRD